MVRKKRQPKITKVIRPPLTKKARAAINVYVDLKCPDGLYALREDGIGYVLEADRMPREKLYSYLKYRGYRWRTVDGWGNKYWMKNHQ